MTQALHQAMESTKLVAAPETADAPPAKLVFHALAKLDYDGPPLDEKTAQMLRERFEPKDPTQTVWF